MAKYIPPKKVHEIVVHFSEDEYNKLIKSNLCGLKLNQFAKMLIMEYIIK